MSCSQVVESGVYVLGALPPSQRLAFEAHMAHCQECRAEVNELAVLPGLLGRLSPESLDPGTSPGMPGDVPGDVPGATAGVMSGVPRAVPRPPENALPSLIKQVNRRRRVRRFSAFAGAFAAACLALVVGLALPYHGDQAPTVAGPVVWHQMRPASAAGALPLTAEVALTSTDNGTAVSVKCVYRKGVAVSPSYQGSATFSLFVYSHNGAPPQQIGTWSARPGEDLTVPAVTAWPLGNVAEVELRGPDGTPLLDYEVT